VPSDGITSVSLWDTVDPAGLQEWLAENLGSDCRTELHEVRGKEKRGALGSGCLNCWFKGHDAVWTVRASSAAHAALLLAVNLGRDCRTELHEVRKKHTGLRWGEHSICRQCACSSAAHAALCLAENLGSDCRTELHEVGQGVQMCTGEPMLTAD
jgi:hypothetical protein